MEVEEDDGWEGTWKGRSMRGGRDVEGKKKHVGAQPHQLSEVLARHPAQFTMAGAIYCIQPLVFSQYLAYSFGLPLYRLYFYSASHAVHVRNSFCKMKPVLIRMRRVLLQCLLRKIEEILLDKIMFLIQVVFDTQQSVYGILCLYLFCSETFPKYLVKIQNQFLD